MEEVAVERVVVAGGGYAGLQVALRLVWRCGSRCAVTLIDRSHNHQLLTKLPQIVGGRLQPRDALIPYARLIGREIRHLRSEVLAFDPGHLAVETSTGRITGDYLVVALGSAPTFGVPGAAGLAFPLRSVATAEVLRRRLEEVAESRTGHVVIVGGGYTGTEVAGELAEWGSGHSGSGSRSFSVTLIAPEGRLLSEGDPRLGAAAERILRKKGVVFHLHHGVRAVEQDHVLLESGTVYPADVVIWATRAHAASPELPGTCPLPGDGRIPVDPYLRPARYERVYVVGDAAAPYDFSHDRIVAASAQMAVEEGMLVGSNLAAALRGSELEEFHPHVLGEALTLGGSSAVAEVGGVILSGRAAIAVKRAALARYLYRLGGSSLVRDYA